jgi:glucosyl-3-phosphoglycerate phosphatase
VTSVTPVTRLIVWRHGQTAWNAAGRLQGQIDVDLDAVGVAQAAAAAPPLAAFRPAAIVSSDLLRTRRTADALAAVTGLPVATDPRLRERNYGGWEGLTHAEIQAGWPDGYRAWQAGDPNPGCGIEPLADLAKRAAEGLAAAVEHAPGGTVVAVTHGGSSKRGVGALLGWPDEVVQDLVVLDNCHWAELTAGRRGWRLRAYNVGPVPA